MASFILFVKGMIAGIPHVVPGLSTGTFLVMMGIYNQFLEAVSGFFSNREKVKSYLAFLLPLGIGNVVGTLIFAKVATFVLERYPIPTLLFLIGLIAGSLPGVLRIHHDMKPSIGRALAFTAGLAAAIAIGLLQRSETTRALATDTSSVAGLLYFGIVALFAGCAVITPGLSGSYIFLLGGTYEAIMRALDSLTDPPIHWGVILSTAVGAAIGFLGFSKVISWLLKRQPAMTFYAILGLIVGSLVGLWPSGLAWNTSTLFGILALLVGAIAATLLGRSAEPRHLHPSA